MTSLVILFLVIVSLGFVVPLVCLFVFLLVYWRLARSPGFVFMRRGLVRFSAKRAAHLAAVFGQAHASCQRKAYNLLLPWYRKSKENENDATRERSLAGIAIWLLIILVISLVVIMGELPIAALRGAALYPFLTQTLLHLPLDLYVGLLWIFVPGIYATWLGETVGLIPEEAGMLVYRNIWQRIGCGAIAFAGIVFSLWKNYELNAYAQCLLVPSCKSSALLPVSIAAGFSLVLIGAGVLSLIGLFHGCKALLSLWFTFWQCVWYVCQQFCEFVSFSAADYNEEVLSRIDPYTAYLTDTPVSEYDQLLPGTGVVPCVPPKMNASNNQHKKRKETTSYARKSTHSRPK